MPTQRTYFGHAVSTSPCRARKAPAVRARESRRRSGGDRAVAVDHAIMGNGCQPFALPLEALEFLSIRP